MTSHVTLQHRQIMTRSSPITSVQLRITEVKLRDLWAWAIAAAICACNNCRSLSFQLLVLNVHDRLPLPQDTF